MTRIQVTSSDIVNGIRADCNRCPIAHAINRTYNQKGQFSINVQPEVIYVVDKTYRTFKTIPLSNEAKNFVAMFDKLGVQGVLPFDLCIAWEFPDVDDNGMHTFSEFDLQTQN